MAATRRIGANEIDIVVNIGDINSTNSHKNNEDNFFTDTFRTYPLLAAHIFKSRAVLVAEGGDLKAVTCSVFA